MTAPITFTPSAPDRVRYLICPDVAAHIDGDGTLHPSGLLAIEFRPLDFRAETTSGCERCTHPGRRFARPGVLAIAD